MYNTPFNGVYSPQINIDRINSQIAELEKMKNQLQQPIQAPANLTQNFQIAPTNREVIRYANSIEDVQRDLVIGDTPYFSKDMSIVWVKSTNGEIKAYELKEIIQKDEKDLQIELLQAQIENLKKGAKYEPGNTSYDEPVESKKPANVSNGRTSKTKSK